MKTHPNKFAHQVVTDLLKIHVALGEARLVLADDRVVAHPLVTAKISDTPYWNDALLIGKSRARKRLHEARLMAWRLINITRKGHETELATLAAQMTDKINDVLSCLNKHGNNASNEDRIAARHAVETPWHLSSVAIRNFFSTELACAALKNGGESMTRVRLVERANSDDENHQIAFVSSNCQPNKEKFHD